jgi:hypothetical protein
VLRSGIHVEMTPSEGSREAPIASALRVASAKSLSGVVVASSIVSDDGTFGKHAQPDPSMRYAVRVGMAISRPTLCALMRLAGCGGAPSAMSSGAAGPGLGTAFA